MYYSPKYPRRRIAAVGSHPAGPSSTIASLTVLPANGIQASGVDGIDAADANGWVAKVTLPDDGVSTFDPTKITLTVSDPGFDTDGSAVTRTRTLTGTAIIRKQYPNQAQRLNSASGGTRTVYFALSGLVFSGSTITAATAAAGYYGGAAAGSIGGVTSNSTLGYPTPQFTWLNTQHERATGTGFAVEAAVYHDLARNGQQVACVEFYGRDAAGGNASAVQRASLPALSDFQSGGQRVEAWKATIPLATLPQGDLCQVIAVVKPWIGAAFDLSVSGVGTLTAGTPVDTAQPHTPLRFVCDKTGAYGGAHFAVKAGAVGGSVQATYALAVTTPFPTVQAGIAALPAWNNANKGHNDHSGATGWAMDDGAGGAVDHAIGATSATAGKCWTDIKVDPAATGAVRLTVTGFIATADLLRFSVPFFVNATGNNALDGGSAANVKRIGFDGATHAGGASVPSTGLTYRFGLCYWRNVSFTDAFNPWSKFSTNRMSAALVLGCTGNLVGSTLEVFPYAFVGNRVSGVRFQQFGAGGNPYPQDGGIIANNILLKCPDVSAIGDATPITGFARVQNVFETASGYSAGAAAWRIGADGQVSAISSFISMHNTIPGVGVGSSNQGRQNACYGDVAGAVGVQKQMSEKFDLVHQRNCKTDTFTTNTTVTGRTGDWRVRYGVGNLGNVVVTGDAQGGLSTVADPSGGNWSGEYLEPGSTWAATEANVTYTDNKAGSAGAGGGTYSLTGATNAAYARVPAGRGVLRYDLAGALRRQDGTGAAGAYERP